MYLVPGDIPKNCNNCPFGVCHFSFPFKKLSKNYSQIDGKENEGNSYGYNCNLDFEKNGKYTKVMRAKIGEDIKKPAWCYLRNFKE